MSSHFNNLTSKANSQLFSYGYRSFLGYATVQNLCYCDKNTFSNSLTWIYVEGCKEKINKNKHFSLNPHFKNILGYPPKQLQLPID